MSRLIDADDAINIFTNRLFEMLKTQIPCVTATESNTCLETCYKIAKYEIDNIPTAYDVEKVAEELSSNSRFVDDINEHNIKCISCVIGQKTAIDIVKRGGVE